MYALIKKGKTLDFVGKKHSISKERVRQIIQKYWGVSSKKFSHKRPVIKNKYKCNFCKSTFLKNKDSYFCSTKCHSSYVSQKVKDDCPRHDFISSGRRYTGKKYVTVYVGLYPNGNPKYQYEHRILMEKKLGRKLKRHEHVHHRDGNGLNNDISNLELLDAKTHASKTMHGWSKKLKYLSLGKVMVDRKAVDKVH